MRDCSLRDAFGEHASAILTYICGGGISRRVARECTSGDYGLGGVDSGWQVVGKCVCDSVPECAW